MQYRLALSRSRNVLCSLALAVLSASTHAQVVISQVFGGGASTGATYTNDFIELSNRGTTAQSLNGWSVQYASANGTSWAVVSLTNVTLQPGQYYLVQMGGTTAGALPLPAPDTSSNTGMSSSSGKVLLASTTTAQSGPNPTGAQIIDKVAYGSADSIEGSPAPVLTVTTANFRKNNGCIDTNTNSSDFATGTPRPRTTTSPRNLCALGLSETATDTDPSIGSIDGSRAAGEYGPSNSYAFGGDGAGFAGMLGYFAANPLQPRIYFNSDYTGLNVGLQLGANLGNPVDANTVVLLLDTKAGGVSGNTTIPFNNGDSIQLAIARTLQAGLPTGFAADYAVGFNRFGVFSWGVASSGLTFLGAGVGATELASQFREIRLTYAQMGGFTPGSAFTFVVALNNGQPSPNTFMSDECIPVSPAFSGAGNPGNSGGTLTNFNRFTTVPCPTLSISAQPPSAASQCPGGTTSFSLTAANVTSYLWQQSTNSGGSWQSAAGANTSPTYTTQSGAAAGTQFRCLLTNICGDTLTSNVVVLSYNSTITISQQPAATLSVCPGDTPTLSVAASGTSPSYAWEYSTNAGVSWLPAPGNNSLASYTLPSVQAADNNNRYRVIVSNICGSATSSSCILTVRPLPTLTLTTQLQGVTSGTTQRCLTITLITANCPTGTSYDVLTTFTSGTGVSTITGLPCGVTPSAISVRDRKHSLRRTASAGTSAFDTSNPDAFVATFTQATSKLLLGGNVNDDDFVDILDFGGFIGAIGTSPGSNSACNLSALHPDFSGDGLVDTADFTYISTNYLAARDVDGCGSPVIADPNQPGGPVLSAHVFDLARDGQWDSARADFNLDGRLDVADVQLALASALSVCVADFNSVSGVSTQDLFDYLNAWAAGHPKADINRDHTLGVQDLFDFLAAWFAGC